MQSLQPQLAAKLAQYRSVFEASCSGLFGGGATITINMDEESSEPKAIPPGIDGGLKGPPTEPDPVQRPALATAPEAVTANVPAPQGSGGRELPSPSGDTPSMEARRKASAAFDAAPTVATEADCLMVRAEIGKALHFIADDFATQFNARLMEAAENDPSVEAVAPNYVMGPQHVDELEELLAQPLKPLLDKLEADDVEGARRATVEAWPPLEKRIRSKWQAYFVMTFQDVSVERKAARDRKKLAPSVDPAALEQMSQGNARMRGMPDFAAPRTWEEAPRRSLWPWLVLVVLLVAAAAAGGFLFMRQQAQKGAAPVTQPK